ncbi:MAG: terminase small subunit [Fibromonadales bacterium]|nr:terminase small subunit [Fibromonadales bacterium]
MNIMQENFVNEYLKNGDAAKAAVTAGYSKSTAAQMGYKLLNKPHIKAAIEKERMAINATEKISREISREIYRDSILDYISRAKRDQRPNALTWRI